jgi:hypothetical protein
MNRNGSGAQLRGSWDDFRERQQVSREQPGQSGKQGQNTQAQVQNSQQQRTIGEKANSFYKNESCELSNSL